MCQEWELRSITNRGRPKGTFSDPVLRLRSWYWLTRLQHDVGVQDALALDKGALMKGVPSGRRFQSIADDGFDPAQTQVTKTLSLLDHVCKKKRHRALRELYDHPLWRILQDRDWNKVRHEAMLDEALQKINLVVLDSNDAESAYQMGLQWHDHFTTVTHEPIGPGYPPEYEYVPVLRALDDPDLVASFATLDGILALVMLFRHSVGVGELDFANKLHRALGEACQTFGKQWQGEAADTWRYVTKARVLGWMPDFVPSPKALRNAENALLEEFRNTERRKRGRASLAPNETTRGKVARRWRRRALMKACATTEPYNVYRGFQTRTPFNAWLTGHRQVIKKQIDWATYRLYVGEGDDPEFDSKYRDLPPLEPPVDDDHTICAPYVDWWEEYQLGGTVFGLLPIRPKRLDR